MKKTAIILLAGIMIMIPIRAYEEKIYHIALEYYVELYAKKYDIEERVVWAVIWTENPGRLFRHRYERHLQFGPETWYRDAIKGSPYVEYWEAYASYGAMHILYGVAYSYGFRGHPFTLQQDKYSIDYGCRHLKAMINTHKKLLDAISSYNQGGPWKRKNGKYKNQAHVDKFTKNYEKLGGKL